MYLKFQLSKIVKSDSRIFSSMAIEYQTLTDENSQHEIKWPTVTIKTTQWLIIKHPIKYPTITHKNNNYTSKYTVWTHQIVELKSPFPPRMLHH